MSAAPVALVGGAGFIGHWLAGELERRGVPFAILDIRRPPAFARSWRQVDIRERAALTGALPEGCEVVVHLAAVHRDDVRERRLYDEVNVAGTRNLAAAAAARGVRRIVFTSSVAVYGFAAPQTGEDGPIRPFNDYGRTKAEAERVLADWRAGGAGRELIVVRPTVVFGPGNRGNVHNLLSQIARRRFVMVGPGTNRKSMAYVENLAAFLAHCTACRTGDALLNYVDGPDLTMNELVSLVRERLHGRPGVGLRLPMWAGLALGAAADAVAALTGTRLPVSRLRVRKFCAETSFRSAAHGFEGFRAPVSLREGLERTLEAEFIAPDPARPVFETE